VPDLFRPGFGRIHLAYLTIKPDAFIFDLEARQTLQPEAHIMEILALTLAAIVPLALLASMLVTRYDLRADIEGDYVELDIREGWAHVERSLYRLDVEEVTDSNGHTYTTTRDQDTGKAMSRVVTSAARAWYELTEDRIVLALDVLRQCCDLRWDWTPIDSGEYAMVA
jgi:hypothetical protein